MKKLITAMLALAAIAPLSAQQLPNNGFEEPWVDCYPWSSNTNFGTKTQKQGTTPTSWTTSNVYAGTGVLSAGNVTVSDLVAGHNSSSAVKVSVKDVKIKQIPGYFTLGTTWSTSTGMGNNMDGGTWGGHQFSYRPDAVSFWYKSTGKEGSVVAYMWSGTYKQADVPANIVFNARDLKKVTMEDRDRQILKDADPDLYIASERQGGNMTESGTLIAYNKENPAVAADWTECTLPLIYKSTTETPEKINVIFSAGDYFSQPTSADVNNTMTVDDVKLLYYSRLKTITVNGIEANLEDAVFDEHGHCTYDLSESVYMPKSEEELSYTLLGESPAKTVSVALDAENNTATITVKNTNEGAQDVDNKAEHVYTIKFKAPDYSRLKTLSVNGTEVPLTDGIYAYDLSESVYMPKNIEAFDYTVMGEASAVTVDIALDAENNTATITVKNTNEGATDVDGEAEHVYTIKFKAPRVFTGIEYPGQITKLTMDMGDGAADLIEEPTDASIWMTQKGMKRIVDVLLPDLTLPGLGNLGDILVEDVRRTYNNNNGNPIYDYSGHVDDLALLEGNIHAVVDLEGTSDVDGNVSFKIHVKWVANYEDLHPQAIVAREPVEPVYYPIEVEFNGKTETPEVPTGINDVTVDGADAPVEYFDLQGIRVSNPQAGQMVIRRQGAKVEKIIVK